MATITRTIRNIQFVISVSQAIPDITAKIIIVIIIAANNFAQSIIYKLQNKPFNLLIYTLTFQAFFTYFLTLGISYFFQFHYHMFHNAFYQGAEFQLVSFFLFIRFKYGGVP